MIKNHYNIKDEFGRRKLPTKRLARTTGFGNAFSTQTEIRYALALKSRLVEKVPIGLEKMSNERDGPTKVPYQSGAETNFSGENLRRRTTFRPSSGEIRSNDFDCRT